MMTSNLTNLVSSFVIITINIIILSSNSLMFIWFLMELNTMIVYFIMSNQKSFSWKMMSLYFSIQSTSSLMIMWYIALTQFYMMLSTTNNQYSNIILLIAISVKMGLFPFHMWPPYMFMTNSWLICFILMSLQKIPPFMMILNSNLQEMMMIMIPLTAMTSAIMNMYTTNLKKMMGLASNIHTSWMIMCMEINFNTWMIYFLMYSIMMMVTCNLLSFINTENMITDSFNIKNIPKSMKIVIMSMTISMMSIPPSSMFIIKWMPLESTLYQNQWLVTAFLIASSMLSIIYYLRISLTMFLGNFPVSSQLKSWDLNKLYILTLLSVVFTTSPIFMLMWWYI